MSEVLNNEKALVVFSGGQDSTTCLFYAKKHFKEVELVTFEYGQRHVKEIEVAKEIAEDQGLKHHVLDMALLSQLTPNALTSHDMTIESHNDVPNTFVPARNLLFLSFAGALAYQIGAKHLITGVCETDFSGYPDCRDSFIKSMNVTLNLAMDRDFVIHTPLMWLNKKETWALSDDLGVLDYVRDRTLTCYNGIIAEGCGECPACQLRQRGLEQYLAERGREV
ncbi:TPA: 7-cyano-7-deazaguanine synthase QueC [Staphylococcus pseudintermedius]|uniref:7-cyano-7-deazaguanine synthase QueC n=1 Tax=Staphylococcus pseudintermedius TaxID=283734 RepID=UPI0001F6BDF7|nr:7-cyano-7-deazaguanine synthase QueC [Staphylococcus pseudintermedius]ADV04950.1 Queuosine Biosynthesis QueC ATPase [Staphylococcus pseudintermedius HKU10-03]EGQ1725753.1 7-cyano-7-deazaguanine synthase QueC [Staphylococcus pseudintermedius]ELJ9247345.1 7-cyano-7-deazaguanine synthase QueC [Staphylococcus pseudintermedius]MCE5775236.1 7-cyano-7-deazaguanine synthase QueC [Staphylococcus pseudintermedius]MDK4015322.1 7-cyano-7-deazaguanine synthase QueC [Staphylococcus pseudintermedius]